MNSHLTFDNAKLPRYDPEYISQMTVKCKCGHSVTIFNRYRRAICSFCGRNVFLTKKDEYRYKLNKMILKGR